MEKQKKEEKYYVNQIGQTIHSKSNLDRCVQIDLESIYDEKRDLEIGYRSIERKKFERITHNVTNILHKICNNINFTKTKLKDVHLEIEPKYKISNEKNFYNEINEKFYSYVDESFINNFYGTLLYSIFKTHKKNFYFQKKPTVRFNFGRSIFEDWTNFDCTIHTDISLGHNPNEMNVWVPFTDNYDTFQILPFKETKSLLIESKYNFETLAEMVLDKGLTQYIRKKSIKPKFKPGQFIEFDSRLLHGTLSNRTNFTRVSSDVRYIESKYLSENTPPFVGTGRKKSLFIPGEFFDKKSYFEKYAKNL